MVLIIISFFLCYELKAAGEWWTLPRSEDDDFHYYVGSSEGKASFTDLQERAFNRALGEVIREHFGVSVQISENSVEELDGSSLQSITKQHSDPITLLGVTQLRTYETDKFKSKRVYVQIRVSKKSLDAAIAAHKSRPSAETFNQYGDPHDTKTSIKVKTNPSGALIAFTHLGQRLSLQGQGDAHFYLPQGRYQMVVSAPGYMAVSKEIHLQAEGREETVELEELHTKLQIHIIPEDASISFNGRPVESDAFKLQIGKVHRFKFSHPDYLSQEIEISTQVPEVLSRTITLEPKISTLQYVIQPSNASIEIDGEEVSLYEGRIHVTPGVKNVRIFKKNYFDYTHKVSVSPNRDYPAKFVYLKLDDLNTPPSEVGFALRFEYNPLSFQGKKGRFHFFPVGLFAEWNHLSLGVGYHYSSERSEEKLDDGSVVKEDKSAIDFYGTARIFTPKLGPFKAFGSYTMGSVSEKKKKSNDIKKVKNSKTYSGLGGGLRIYLSPRWSVSGEYFKTKVKSEEALRPRAEDRFVLGLSYEF